MVIIYTLFGAGAVDIGGAFRTPKGISVDIAFPNLATLISPLIQNVFVLAGVVLVLLLIFGGVTYIMNAGSGDKEGVEKGKNALTSALLGFIIIFVAYWIIVIIEYITGQPIFNSGL